MSDDTTRIVISLLQFLTEIFIEIIKDLEQKYIYFGW